MDVGGRATQDAKAEDFVALRDFVRERRTGEYGRLNKTPLERQRTSESGSTFMESKPAELPRQLLAELSMNLSAH